MNAAIIAAIAPKLAGGGPSFLLRHGDMYVAELFDKHGWKAGWIRKTALAAEMFPKLSQSAGRNYLTALVDYLVAEGKETGEPQIGVRHGEVSFEHVGVQS